MNLMWNVIDGLSFAPSECTIVTAQNYTIQSLLDGGAGLKSSERSGQDWKAVRGEPPTAPAGTMPDWSQWYCPLTNVSTKFTKEKDLPLFRFLPTTYSFWAVINPAPKTYNTVLFFFLVNSCSTALLCYSIFFQSLTNAVGVTIAFSSHAVSP